MGERKQMPSFSKTSRARLSTCHVDLQVIFNEVIKSKDCSIFCGHRDKFSQNKAKASGKSQLSWPDSNHNSLPSNAVDAGPYFVELKNTDWEDHVAYGVFAGYVMATADRLLVEGKISHKLRWGGDWDSDGRTSDERFNDYPHFELVSV